MHWDKIDEPLSWRKPRKVFVNSMSDLFHEDSDIEFVRDVFAVMQKTPRHQYQVLTKRPQRMAEWLTALRDAGDYEPASHIWLGTSIENNLVAQPAEQLRGTAAVLRFLSCEPLLGPLDELHLDHIDWLIVGGESGTHLWEERARARRGLVDYVDGAWSARDDRVSWVEALRDHRRQRSVPPAALSERKRSAKCGGIVVMRHPRPLIGLFDRRLCPCFSVTSSLK